MNNSVTGRLGFVIASRPELLARLQVQPGTFHILCESYAVISPALDYETWFEGWRRSWVTKAKRDYIAMVLRHCADQFPDFAAELRADSSLESFEKWWTISRISVMEIDSAWRPSSAP